MGSVSAFSQDIGMKMYNIQCGTVLRTTIKENDLWLIISTDMKVSEQCGIVALKANQILGLIRRNI